MTAPPRGYASTWCLYTPSCDRVDERGVVALGLIGVGLGEDRDPTVEHSEEPR